MARSDSMDVGLKGLEKACADRGWSMRPGREVPYGLQVRVSDGGHEASVTLYRTGKALIQGSEGPLLEALREWWSPGVGGRRQAAHGDGVAAGVGADLAGRERIGMDESGKGDYFGPLVTAAVYVDSASEARLAEMGVADSKCLSDKAVRALSPKIVEMCQANVVTVGPARYNEMYASFSNLNRMLAAVHARCLAGLLSVVACDTAIADQFADEAVLARAVAQQGCQVRLVQRHRAESDMAVAAASVVARGEFVRAMDELSASAGLQLPKGSSHPSVEATAAALLRCSGLEGLARYAKLHFAITDRLSRVEH